MNRYSKKRSSSAINWLLSAVGLLFCVVFGFLLICNITIIVKGTIYPERPPSVLSVTPMAVLSGSMSGDAEGHIEVGDLIFVGSARPEELAVGDVIAFMASDGSGTVITHRIIEVQEAENGGIQWRVKGDANNAADENPVHENELVGVCLFRIPRLGDFALFLQKPLGMLLFIGIPVLVFLIYDIIRRQKSANRENQKAAELEAEIARLKALSDGRPEDGGLEER